LWPRLGLSHPLVLGVSHYICSQPLDLMGIHHFHCADGGEKMASHDAVQIVFVTIVWDTWFHVSWKKNPCNFAPCLIFFASLDRHCVINQWCLHIGECYHHQPHLNWFGFKGCFFLWGYSDNYDSSKGWSLSWSVLSKHVSPSNCGGFQMFKLIGRWVSSSMCQHGVGSKGHWRPFTFSFEHILWAKGVSGITLCISNSYFETCCCNRWGSF
jgi:hypothetical protein